MSYCLSPGLDWMGNTQFHLEMRQQSSFMYSLALPLSIHKAVACVVESISTSDRTAGNCTILALRRGVGYTQSITRFEIV